MDNKFINKMLDCISGMQSNIEMSALKVEFIDRYPGLTFSPAGCALAHVFVNQYCTEELAAKSHLITTDALYDDAYKEFESMCKEENEKDNLSGLVKKASEIGYADKVFVSLVRTFQTMSQYIDELYDWAAERIARTVLEYMQKYYTEHWDSGETADEYFLGCLMTEVGM